MFKATNKLYPRGDPSKNRHESPSPSAGTTEVPVFESEKPRGGFARFSEQQQRRYPRGSPVNMGSDDESSNHVTDNTPPPPPSFPTSFSKYSIPMRKQKG
eukprot:PhF_6_TR41703/c0_g1_i2/m.63268